MNKIGNTAILSKLDIFYFQYYSLCVCVCVCVCVYVCVCVCVSKFQSDLIMNWMYPCTFTQFICWSLNPGVMVSIENRTFERRLGPNGRALVWWDWFLFKKRCPRASSPFLCHMGTQLEGGHFQARKRAFSRLWPCWDSEHGLLPPELWENCCFSHQVYILLS